MQDQEILRSQRAFRQETTIIIVVAIILSLLAAIMMRIFIHATLNTYLLSGGLTFLGVMFAAWVAILIRNKKWKSTHYFLGQDALMISRPSGIFGTVQDVYLYESILTVSYHQGYFGKRYGYGDIEITIPKLNSTLVLKTVMKPAEQIPALKARIKAKAGRSRSLVT